MTEAMQILVGFIADARSNLKRAMLPGQPEVRQTLDQALERLERALHRHPTVVVAGEPNSGKTSVANMLTGLDVLPSAVIANTCVPVRLRHGVLPALTAVTSRGRTSLTSLPVSEPLPQFLYSGLQSLEVDLPQMRGASFELLDTPASQGEVVCSDRADILVWCSVAARPWTESERLAVTALPPRLRARSLLVVTHKDRLSPAEHERVCARYAENTAGLFSGMHFVDAATRNLNGVGTDGAKEGFRVGNIDDSRRLQASLETLVTTYWDHRALTGRRLCRHIARLLKPSLPAQLADGKPLPEAGPVAALLSNIAGRLSTI
jgi:Dynamin family